MPLSSQVLSSFRERGLFWTGHSGDCFKILPTTVSFYCLEVSVPVSSCLLLPLTEPCPYSFPSWNLIYIHNRLFLLLGHNNHSILVQSVCAKVEHFSCQIPVLLSTRRLAVASCSSSIKRVIIVCIQKIGVVIRIK